MTANSFDILLIEDNAGDARLIEEMLSDGEELLQRVGRESSATGRPHIHHKKDISSGLERLSTINIDIILLDLNLPDSTGLDTVTTVSAATTSEPIIVLTGLRDAEVGSNAIQHGAEDYIIKDELTSDMLVRTIHHGIERSHQKRERAHRRAQLEALNILSRELMTAESTAQVRECTLEAAEETLDLPITAIGRYDNQSNSLFLAGMTDIATEFFHTGSLSEIGDGAGWEAFVTQEVQRLPAQSLEDNSIDSSITELVIVPLSKYGVLITGLIDDTGSNATDFEFIESVAENAKVAFDRVDREECLQDREQTLEKKNQTLERLNRINSIIRNIAQALVQASSRQEIYECVCTELVKYGSNELVWIGEQKMGTIEPRETAGNRTAFLENLTANTDELEEHCPSTKALATREAQVVNDLIQNRSFESGRQVLLAHSIRSAIALPLMYEETLYGVLTLYSAQGNVFDELAQAVFRELADTIAHAINSVESKKAIVGNKVTRLEFNVSDPNLGIIKMAQKYDCKLSVKDLVPTSTGIRAFFTTRGVSATDVRQFAPQLPIQDLTVIAEFNENEEQICTFEGTLSSESLATTLLEHGGRLHSLQVEDGLARVTIELAADAAVREFVGMFQTKYPDSELVSKQTREQRRQSPEEIQASIVKSLTERQLETLQRAYFGGYFKQPRDQTGIEIAESMDISQPTFNIHLRAAQRKLCEELFAKDLLQES